MWKGKGELAFRGWTMCQAPYWVPISFLLLFVCLFERGSCNVSQTGLELTIILPQPLKCWDYRPGPSYLTPHWVFTESCLIPQ
jgi:hypothetical protein